MRLNGPKVSANKVTRKDVPPAISFEHVIDFPTSKNGMQH